jgi:HEAT repeat protein
LASEIEGLFAAAENENFEDGFSSVLSVELLRLVLQYGDAALEIVSDLIFQNRAAPEVAAEALRCLGQVQSQVTHEVRRRLLERSLASASHVTRDGAAIGLSNLRDPRAIPALEAAAAREDYRLLRANMFEILERLKVSPP